MNPGIDPIIIDPMVSCLEQETEQLCAASPLTRIDLLGVGAWTVTGYTLARQLLTDPRLVKDIGAWSMWTSGEVTRQWPLIGMIDAGRSMFTVDGAEHKRLRAGTTRALTARRLDAIRPVIERLTAELLDDLAAAGRHGAVVDLKSIFAYPLPMRVVSELMGVPAADHSKLLEWYKEFFSGLTPQDRRLMVIEDLDLYFTNLVRHKAAHPVDDLTSAYLTATDDNERMTEEEVVGNLKALVAAGHETTVALLLNATRALLTHPEQLQRLRSGDLDWNSAIEETLRWDGPVTHLLMRFATEDITVGDTTIQQGDGVVMSYRAIGRDTTVYGPDAHNFDISRPITARHTSFGYGPHVCPGAALSRLEAEIALPALFTRFPDIELAAPLPEIHNLPVLTQNDLAALPIRVVPQEQPRPRFTWRSLFMNAFHRADRTGGRGGRSRRRFR